MSGPALWGGGTSPGSCSRSAISVSRVSSVPRRLASASLLVMIVILLGLRVCLLSHAAPVRFLTYVLIDASLVAMIVQRWSTAAAAGTRRSDEEAVAAPTITARRGSTRGARNGASPPIASTRKPTAPITRPGD